MAIYRKQSLTYVGNVAILLKFSKQWRKSDRGRMSGAVQQTADGGYVVTGVDGNYGLLLLKTDGQGIEQWRKTFGRVMAFRFNKR